MAEEDRDERLPRTRLDALAAYVVARALRDGSPTATYDALAAIDPLDRARVRRRVQRARDDATATCPDGGSVHREQLAYLDLVGEYLTLAESADATRVEARFAAAAPKTLARPGYRTTVTAIAAVLLVTAAITAFVVLRPVPFEGLHPGEGGEAAATTRGGVPLHDARLDEVFAETLPAFTLAASRIEEGAPSPELEQASRALTSASIRELVPPDVSTRLATLVRAHTALAEGRGAEDAVFDAVRALDEALLRNGLGYFVDPIALPPTTRGPRIMLATFRVDRVARYEVAGRPQRVLFATRADRLNVRQSSLAYTLPDSDVSVVLVDEIDALLVQVLLPLLAQAPLPTLVDPRTSLSGRPWLVDVHTQAAAIVRRDLADEGRDEALLDVAGLLERRRALFLHVTERTLRDGFTVSEPNRYDFGNGVLERIVPAPIELPELTRLRDTLGEREPVRAFVAARTRVEDLLAWHMLDLRQTERGPGLVTPEPLRALLDPDGLAEPGRFDGGRATRHLSAMLATIARDERTAAIALTLVVRRLVDGRFSGTADEDAAWALIPELARTLGVGRGEAPIALRGSDVAALYVALARLPRARLRDGAARTWARLYGRALPPARRR